eukprot:353778-Chlamydomonas_euryale.AAC.6
MHVASARPQMSGDNTGSRFVVPAHRSSSSCVKSSPRRAFQTLLPKGGRACARSPVASAVARRPRNSQSSPDRTAGRGGELGPAANKEVDRSVTPDALNRGFAMCSVAGPQALPQRHENVSPAPRSTTFPSEGHRKGGVELCRVHVHVEATAADPQRDKKRCNAWERYGSVATSERPGWRLISRADGRLAWRGAARSAARGAGLASTASVKPPVAAPVSPFVLSGGPSTICVAKSEGREKQGRRKRRARPFPSFPRPLAVPDLRAIAITVASIAAVACA